MFGSFNEIQRGDENTWSHILIYTWALADTCYELRFMFLLLCCCLTVFLCFFISLHLFVPSLFHVSLLEQELFAPCLYNACHRWAMATEKDAAVGPLSSSVHQVLTYLSMLN